MRFLVLSTLLLASLAAAQNADAIEIQKQRLVKFPEEFDPNVTTPASGKADEAKRILEQIAKVNEAFGYVKKRPDQSKLPPILDSSQYLFPKPAHQPFHAQQHHFSGSMGQTLLEPSIRAVKLTRNVMPDKKQQLYFKPNRVQLPKPINEQEAKQLPAHFVIPVHLYKLNKEQYLKEKAPQEYRVKGYKIIGDVDSFYGKAKAIHEKQNKKHTKSSPKYHLFFLPRELALNNDGTPKRGTTSSTIATTRLPNGSKESHMDSRERQTSRPQSQPQRISGVVAPTTQSSRKRISSTTKPKEVATPAPSHISSEQLSTLPPAGGLLPNRNRLNVFRVPNVNLAEMQNQTSTAIKNAFQNIFKMPFRTPVPVPGPVTALQPAIPQSHPLQPPEHSDSLQDDYKWDDDKEGGGDGSDMDTLEQMENTAVEQNSNVAAEKHLFAHKHQNLVNTIGTVATAQQGTQQQALREGGIIIQRLKVRKGGIAIAGPGGVATAGSGGTAIVGPGGYALTHPRSLTIAGPGAKVISIPADVDLKDALQRTDVGRQSFPREGKVVATGPTVYYAPPTGNYNPNSINPRHRSGPLIFEEQLPYYGGLNGQLLLLQPQLDGSIRNSIVQQPQLRDSDDTITISAAADDSVTSSTGSNSISASGSNFNRIQEAAARLVAIQELAKRKGAFSAEDNKIYANSLLELGQAATALALLQQTGHIKDFSVLLQPELFGTQQKQPANLGLEANNPADQKIDEQKLDEVTEQHLSPEDIIPPTNEDPYEDVNDSVAVMPPKKDAAVAEAKPVGLSIAGEGGVASSKPNAIALSGRNGLAVASPKATAIAGVTPEEAAAFSITFPSRNQLVIKTPNTAAVAGDDYDYNDAPLSVSSFPRTRDVPPRPGAGSDLVEKWRIAIAEEYAARAIQARAQAQDKTQSNPIIIRAAPKRRLHYL